MLTNFDNFSLCLSYADLLARESRALKYFTVFNICQQSEVSLVEGTAEFVGSGVVEVNGEQYSANHILIATGGAPATANVPGINILY